MEEPRKCLRIILNDPYATEASKKAACKLYNGLRRQVTRRKRANERRDVLAERVAELEAAIATLTTQE